MVRIKKHILEEAFPKYFLNKSIKKFSVPVVDWLGSELRVELLSYIEKPFIEKQNIFQFNSISNLVTKHFERKVDNTFRVWTFLSFQKW
jgi:asparagine synthase (glutamine-hydrolysing)